MNNNTLHAAKKYLSHTVNTYWEKRDKPVQKTGRLPIKVGWTFRWEHSVTNFGHSHDQNRVNNQYYCTAIDTTYNTALWLPEHNNSEQAKYTQSFILFDDNTSRSYSPFRFPKPFVLYSLTRSTVSIDITLFEHVVFIHFSTTAIQQAFFNDSNTTSHITPSPDPQVVPQAVPTVQSSRPPEWIARLIDITLSIKVQAAVSVYCALLHLTLGSYSKVSGQHN